MTIRFTWAEVEQLLRAAVIHDGIAADRIKSVTAMKDYGSDGGVTNHYDCPNFVDIEVEIAN